MEANVLMKNQQTLQQEQKYNQFKETQYCILLNQAEYKVDEYTYCIEKIFIKGEKQQEEVRLALYKSTLDKNGRATTRMVPRPVDLSEEEFLELLKEAISKEILSKAFLNNLKKLLQETNNTRTQQQTPSKSEVKSNEQQKLQEP
jgi:hypothetical protein